MQRDTDAADSGKPRIALYCVKRSMSNYDLIVESAWKMDIRQFMKRKSFW